MFKYICIAIAHAQYLHNICICYELFKASKFLLLSFEFEGAKSILLNIGARKKIV